MFYIKRRTHIIKQMLEFLSFKLKESLSHVNMQYLYEIRIRAGKPTLVNYGGVYRYLGEKGLVDRAENALYSSLEELADCVFRAGKYSVYSIEEELKKGFLTAECGERLGIAGEYVFENGQPLALRNFTSLCIRVPHEIIGCAEEMYQRCMCDKVRSLLISSPPGLGKTTILRDLGRIIGKKTKKNILICDERGEISVGDCGENSDVIRYCDKKTAFEAGIRAMRPDLIITDELSLQDCSALQKAVCAGVQVIASAHFSQMRYVQEAFFDIFEYFVFLKEEKIGKIREIYQKTATGVVQL